MGYLDDLFSLDGKVAIVTGGARGIGKAISGGLLNCGVSVVIADILRKELSDTVDEFKIFDVYPFFCDLRVSKDIESLVEFVIGKYNRVDILINDAGVTIPRSHPYSDSDWDETLSVNLRAPFELIRKISDYMIKQKSGCIINITSLNSEFGFPDNPAYLASKGGLKMMSKGFAVDLGKHGIRVNNVGPGYTHTLMNTKSWNDPILKKQRADRTILGRWAEPADLIGTVLFLASDASSYVTGQDIYVDGGWEAKGL